jgi:hydroxymethylpyrimidine/phosphomethylpyrimidine kinase
MTIAGSDSGGGAGIQADLRTFAALGVHGTSAITAITAQNTVGVSAVCALEAEMVAAQVDAVTSDMHVWAVKTGMLARPKTILKVAELARNGRLPKLVVDPVLVSSTGHALMEEGGVEAYRDGLLPFALVATPNLREAAVLVGVDVREINTIDAMRELAMAILKFGPTHVVIKGGHFAEGAITEDLAPDLLVSAEFEVVLDAERVLTRNDHGTGCSMAAAIAANLALDQDVATAVSAAKSFVLRGLRGGADWRIGAGHGPIDHMGWNT